MVPLKPDGQVDLEHRAYFLRGATTPVLRDRSGPRGRSFVPRPGFQRHQAVAPGVHHPISFPPPRGTTPGMGHRPGGEWVLLAVGTDGMFNHVDRDLRLPELELEIQRRVGKASRIDCVTDRTAQGGRGRGRFSRDYA
jgi:hypothetical protein